MMVRRLALGPFQMAPGAVPLAPWCYLGREAEFPDWHRQPLPAAVRDHAHWLENCTIARHLAWDLAEDLTPELNVRHGTAYDIRFWGIVLMPWLIALSQTVWKRVLEIRAIADAYPGEPFELAIWAEDRRWDFADTADFYNRGVFREEFNWWVTSRLAGILAPPSWTLSPAAAPSLPPERWSSERAGLRVRLITAVLGRVRFDNVIGAGPLASALFSLFLALWPASCRPGRAPRGKPFEGRAPVPSDIFAGMLTIARSTLPRLYREGFAAVDGAATAKRYRTGKLLLKGGALMFNDDAIFETAHADRAGEKVLAVQHGSMYGTAMAMPDLGETEYRHHGLVTWGWKRQRGHAVNAVPLPSPLLSAMKDRHRDRNGRIILVGTQMRVLTTRFDGAPMAHQVALYRQAKVDFVAALSPAARSALSYRAGQPDVAAIEDAAYLRGQVGPLDEVTGPLHPQVLRCRLAVLDHPGTTLNIAMAANVPLVLYWHPAAWPLAPEAKPFFEGLVAAGILHDDPFAAARAVSAVFGDVAGWWRGPSVQQARLAWCRQFAWAERPWWPRWLATLVKL